ncbi:hypothetical protein N7G274_001877 [Stereocaulon virgatum]|uniref:Uncharacterized protein n=1 Tax=Stereocaulon virgatum TaxID=373712 RepID=A0ABR4AKZ0_9LECA
MGPVAIETYRILCLASSLHQKRPIPHHTEFSLLHHKVKLYILVHQSRFRYHSKSIYLFVDGTTSALEAFHSGRSRLEVNSIQKSDALQRDPSFATSHSTLSQYRPCKPCHTTALPLASAAAQCYQHLSAPRSERQTCSLGSLKLGDAT